MLNFLPLPLPILKAMEYQTLTIVSDSKYTRYILKWFLLCALTEDCISPKGSKKKCKRKKDQINAKFGCHRQDQAIWNILQLNYIFHPKIQGALEYKMVEKWEEYSQEFVNKVLEKRNEVILEFQGKIKAKRRDVINNYLNLAC